MTMRNISTGYCTTLKVFMKLRKKNFVVKISDERLYGYLYENLTINKK